MDIDLDFILPWLKEHRNKSKQIQEQLPLYIENPSYVPAPQPKSEPENTEERGVTIIQL